ncbi:MAG: diphthine--ammonia ligase [Thermoprotei archaeon]|nr:MAG: diphthine--ammonia ligase [Thermoprotei archaeon]
MKFCALFSGGKDSTYALHLAMLKGLEITCLITLKPLRENSWMFHYPSIDFTKLQAKALNLPQIFKVTSGVKGEEIKDLDRAVKEAIEKYNIEGIVVGALLSDYQRMNVMMIAEKYGLETYTPLWRKDQKEYIRDVVRHGIKFIITEINAFGLPMKFLGKEVTLKDVEEIIRYAEKYKFNPAFEGGEAETLVIDAPMFKKKLHVEGRILRISEFSGRYVIEKVELIDK